MPTKARDTMMMNNAQSGPGRRQTRRAPILVALVMLAALLVPLDVHAAINNDPAALAFAEAIATDPGIITGASFLTKPPTTGTVGVGDSPLNDFPVHGSTFGIMSSGNTASADDGAQSIFASSSMGGGNVRGDTDFDVTVLAIDFAAPAGSDCLTITFRFMSEEFPEYVGSSFNEAFIAELDASTWSVSGTTITAPNNFAFDQNGNVLSINAVGGAMTAEGAAGTVYDGGTLLLQASAALTAGPHTLYLSIFDMSDSSYDSAILIDRLIVGTNGPGGCEPGFVPADPIAAFTFLPASPLAGEAVQFTDASSDPDGTIVSWSWDFGDAATSTDQNPTHTYASGGTFTVTLTVTDDSGATGVATDQIVVTFLDPPGAPVDLVATAGTALGTIDLSWLPPTSGGSVDGYRVFGADPTDPFELIGEPGSSTLTFTESGLGQGVTRTYVVHAFNADGESPASNEATATTLAPPGVPFGLVATTGTDLGTIDLVWQPPTTGPADAYDVFGADAVGGFLQIGTTSGLTFTESGLGNGVTRRYHVVAVNEDGQSAPSNEDSATTLDPPGVPVAVVATTGDGAGSIDVSWQPPASGGAVTGYRVYAADPGQPFGLIGDVSVLFFTESGLGNGVTRHYIVRAYNADGQSGDSPVAIATTLAPPGAPIDVAAATGSIEGTIDLSWLAPEAGPVDGYRVFGADPGETPGLIGETGPTETSFTESGLGDGVAREYEVRAFNAAGESLPSDLVSAVTMPPVPPGAPVDFTTSSGPANGQITLLWTVPDLGDATAIDRYDLYRGASPGTLTFLRSLVDADLSSAGASAAYVAGDAVTYLDAGLGSGVVLYYELRAANGDGIGPAAGPVVGSTFTDTADPPTLPDGATLTSAVFAGDYAYVFGGLSGNRTDGVSTDAVVRFDPFTGESVLLNVSLGHPRHATSSVWVPELGEAGSAIVIFGTDDANATLHVDSCHPSCLPGVQMQIFDPVTNLLNNLVVLPDDLAPRHSTSAAYVPPRYLENGSLVEGSGRIWIFGGASEAHNESDVGADSCHPSCLPSIQIIGYDVLSNNLLAIPFSDPALEGRSATSAVYVPPRLDDEGAVLNGTDMIYMIAGHPEGNGTEAASGDPGADSCHPSCLPSIQIVGFDPFNQQSSLVPVELPSGRWYTSAVYDGESIFILGGEDHDGATDEVLRFDPVAGTLETVAGIAAPRTGTSAVAVGDVIFLFGGDDGGNATDEIIRYTPTAPQHAQAASGPEPRQATVYWEPPANEGLAPVVAYRIYAGNASDAEVFVGEVAVGTLSFTLGFDPVTGGDLADGQTWFFKVSAVSAVGEGPQSGEVNATTFTVPDAPSALTATLDPLAGGVVVNWSAPADDGGAPVARYQLRRTDFPSGTVVFLAPGSATSYVDTDCDIGSLCTYEVRAFNAVGASAYSNEDSDLGMGLPLP